MSNSENESRTGKHSIAHYGFPGPDTHTITYAAGGVTKW